MVENLLKFLAIIIALAIMVVGAFSYWSYQKFIGYGPLEEATIFNIEQGQKVVGIAEDLADNGVIIDPVFFIAFAKLGHQDTRIKAGEYELWAGISLEELLALFVSGKTLQRSFTISEGLTSWQAVQVLNAQSGLLGEIEEIPEEGSLLPETYYYQRGDTRQSKIEQMQIALKEVLDELWPHRSKGFAELTKREVIILASIVEKETSIEEERQKIAGLFLNRIEKGMRLQTDPSVIYAITNGEIKDGGLGPLGRRLLKKDLEFESPYNTYKYRGLPPGPIANPGKASIKAVLNPETHGYYYFVADGTGGHLFAKTLKEHNQNVAKWRKFRKSEGK